MNIEDLRKLCRQLPAVTEDIKWGNDLCFCIGGKMFCAAPLSGPLSISLKVSDEEFGELTERVGVVPAPYVARYKWIMVNDPTVFSKKEWQAYITRSFHLVESKLSKKSLKELSTKS